MNNPNKSVYVAGRSVADDLILAIGQMSESDLQKTIDSNCVGNFAAYCNQNLNFIENDALIVKKLESYSSYQIADLTKSVIDNGYAGDDLGVIVDMINCIFPEYPISIFDESNPSQNTAKSVLMIERWCDNSLANSKINPVASVNENVIAVKVAACLEQGSKNLLLVTASNNIPYIVRLVSKGMFYGPRYDLEYKETYPLVEFYDARSDHSCHGEFLSRYFLSSLINTSLRGISLKRGVAELYLDESALNTVLTWLNSRDTLSIK